MSVGRGVPILGISVLFSVLSVPAQAQISPNLPLHSLQPPSNHTIVLPQRVDSAPALQPISKHQDTEQSHPHMGKVFWLGWGLAAAFSVASSEMTIRCEHIVGCSEGNPLLFTKKPNRLELYAPRAGVIAAGMLVSRHWKRCNPKEKDSTTLMLGVDAIWGADTAWDAHELSTIPNRLAQSLLGSRYFSRPLLQF
jgi:hypothetical protein